MKRMRYAIVEEDLGFFLGAFQKFGVFAKTDLFGLHKAFSFDTEKEANSFINEYLGRDRGDWSVVSIDTDDKYINVVDLLKSGYDRYTHQMIDGLTMPNIQVH